MRRLLLPLLALALLLPLAAPAAAQDGGPPPTREQQFPIQHLDPHEAEVMALDQCSPEHKLYCMVTTMRQESGGLYLVVRADHATLERVARKLAERDVVPHTQAFQVTLVLATKAPNGASGDLPPAAATALEDVRALLPYTHYEVIDSAYLATARTTEATLAGPDGLPIEARLAFGSRVLDQIFVHGFRIRSLGTQPERQDDGTLSPGVAPRNLIDTSFSMTAGETLVVGTSRMAGGEKAVLALVTAVE